MAKKVDTELGKDTSLEVTLSIVLRLGLSLAFVTALAGGALLLWQSGSQVVSYQVFTSEPPYLKEIGAIFTSAMKGEGIAIVQAGILLMIATPIVRVLLCVVVFLVKKDFLYVCLSGFVLTVLLYSFFYKE